jgi:glycerol uptake facilitator-like aquaporin
MINWKALVAEFIGTFTLVFVGSAAVWFAKTTPGYAAARLSRRLPMASSWSSPHTRSARSAARTLIRQ